MKLEKIIQFSLLVIAGVAAFNSSAQTSQKNCVKQVSKSCAEPTISTPSKGISKAESCHSHQLGFTSLTSQSADISLPLTGSLPEWINGSLIAVGPGVFELKDSKACGWLDGFAMIHQFSVEKGKVKYSNKLIDSFYYQDCCKKGKLRGSTPDQKKSTWSKLTSAIGSSPRPPYDNTNVNVAIFNNQLVALTETPDVLQINPKTLQTKEKFVFNDTLEAHYASPHMIFDPSTKEWYGVAIQYAHNSDYIIYKMKENSNQRNTIARVSVSYPAYIHSFALTKNYVIITEIPFTVSPYDLLLSDNSFIDNFTWNPKNGTTFIVIDRKTGKKVGSYKTEPFFMLHHVNAFETLRPTQPARHSSEGATAGGGREITIDLIAYKDASIAKAFNMKNLCSPHTQVPAGHLKRFIIDQKTGKITSHLLSPHHTVELPQINPAKLMHDYQYAYATASNENGVAQQLVKFDLHSKRHDTWHCKGCYPTEAIFIPKPNAPNEDDGIILSVILDAAQEKSFLLILDAKNMKELARAYVPHHVPFTVHSKFFAK